MFLGWLFVDFLFFVAVGVFFVLFCFVLFLVFYKVTHIQQGLEDFRVF